MQTATNASSFAHPPRLEAAPVVSTDTLWKPLYRLGGAAAATLLALMVLGIIALLTNPPPTTVIGFFTLLQKNAFLGLLALDLVYLVSQVLMGLIVHTLCVALRRVSPSTIVLALTSGLVGLAVYFTSNPAFSMLALSDQYAAATTATQRSQVEAAGQAIMANYTGTAYDVSYVLRAWPCCSSPL